MYGIADTWAVMAMPTYLDTKKNMLMDMGPMMSRMGPKASDPMSTGGLGDIEVRGAYRINGVLTDRQDDHSCRVHLQYNMTFQYLINYLETYKNDYGDLKKDHFNESKRILSFFFN